MKIFALLVLAGTAGTSLASIVTNTFTSFGTASYTNKNSIDAQGDVDNNRDTFVATSGGTVNAIRVNGNLTSIASGTFASEARVRFTAGAGNAFTGFNLQASTVGTYSTLVVGPTQFAVTPFTLAAGTVNLEWFESAQDGAANIAESRWNTVSYEFGNGSSTITNGSFALGTINPDGIQVCGGASGNVSGGLDFYTVNFAGPGALSLTDYVNIQTLNTTGGVAYDTEMAIYDSLGNKVSENDDSGVNAYSQLSYGVADPLAVAASGVAGFDGATFAAGAYTIVVGGFNTTFPATLAGTFTAGTAVGNHQVCIQYVPTPGTAVLAGLAGLFAARRRRA